jgi:hypothetical protein
MPQLELQLAAGREAWDPGENMDGTIRLHSGHEWTADYIELVLWWHTTGKGQQDKGVMHRHAFAQKGQRIPTRVDHNFRVKLPSAPWTYHGRLIKIEWFVAAYARESGRDEEAVIVPIRLFPGGKNESVAPEHLYLPDDAPPEE